MDQITSLFQYVLFHYASTGCVQLHNIAAYITQHGLSEMNRTALKTQYYTGVFILDYFCTLALKSAHSSSLSFIKKCSCDMEEKFFTGVISPKERNKEKKQKHALSAK